MGIDLNSRGSNTAPALLRAEYPAAVVKEALPDTISIRTFQSMCKFASVDGNNLNDLKKLMQIMPTRKNFARQAQGHLWRALSNKVHHGKVGGLHPTHGGTGGKIGTRCEFSVLFQFFLFYMISLAQKSDFHQCDGEV